ncbi:MAG: HAMP domain-containing histidine kinase [Bacteroidia bacterium]
MQLNNYEIKRLLKFALLIFAFLIGFFSLWYTNTLVKRLEAQERQKIETWAKATRMLVSPDLQDDPEFLFSLVQQNNTIPVIMTDDDGVITGHRNLDSNLISNEDYFEKKIAHMKEVNEPMTLEWLEGRNLTIYYENSLLLNQLRIYPYFQLAVIALFLAMSYFAFSYSRRSEQNKVWAGMSKETAHQLGTPISSLMAWVDYLEQSEGQLSENVISEIKKDMNRLELITERFSKIGSEPVLEKHNLVQVLQSSVQYIDSRTSDRVKISIDESSFNKDLEVMVNEPLFAWVIENLCKNAVDAMEGEGKITFRNVVHASKVIIEVIDTGKGLSSTQYKTIFKPGYTTKKRGWGLGLSLVKRIIENYHNGKIYVKHSEIGKGTTFRLELKPSNSL